MQLIIRIILGFVVGAAAGGLITYLYVTTSAKSKIQEMLDNAEKEASSIIKSVVKRRRKRKSALRHC